MLQKQLSWGLLLVAFPGLLVNAAPSSTTQEVYKPISNQAYPTSNLNVNSLSLFNLELTEYLHCIADCSKHAGEPSADT